MRRMPLKRGRRALDRSSSATVTPCPSVVRAPTIDSTTAGAVRFPFWSTTGICRPARLKIWRRV